MWFSDKHLTQGRAPERSHETTPICWWIPAATDLQLSSFDLDPVWKLVRMLVSDGHLTTQSA